MQAPRSDVARVHLHVLGQDRRVEAPVPLGPTDPLALLPAARAIAAEVVAASVDHARAAGREVACRAGCSRCCHHLVPISVIEATSLAAVVAAMPADRRDRARRRFAEAVRRLESIGLLDRRAPRGRRALRTTARPEDAWHDVSRRYFDAGIPCPLLEDDRCSVYDDRPLVCREYAVTTPPERCATLDGGAEAIERPLHLSEVLGEVARGLGVEDAPMIPLALALEWADARGARLRAPRDGEELARRLLDELARAGDAAADPHSP